MFFHVRSSGKYHGGSSKAKLISHEKSAVAVVNPLHHYRITFLTPHRALKTQRKITNKSINRKFVSAVLMPFACLPRYASSLFSITKTLKIPFISLPNIAVTTLSISQSKPLPFAFPG
ncbi:hypothetical protein EPI10_010293 [Gossypium australe]|uniref:Uncharacterized protein n=1 Tax=Gossypium australe TaxID=47621 RepID=A0A5B6W3T2_9ROSI|nr:hypothetical protein EPI10_010293 [Gossypium australe]